MNDKRDEIMEAAVQFLLSPRVRNNDFSTTDLLANFASSREAEIRRQIADELQELRSNVVDVEFLQGRLDIFEEQIRGKQ